MIKANFNAYSSYVTDSLYQWDINQVLRVSGLNLAVVPEVHFSNSNMDKAIVRTATMSDHIVSVRIPNSLLQDPLTISAHIGIYEGATFKVVEKIEIPVIAKARPADYQIEDADEEIYSFKALETAIANMTTKAEANVISARIDTIVANANSTEGNSELVDMRVGADGTVFPTAGTVVRKREELHENLSVMTVGYTERATIWENGNLNSSGVTNRIRTQLLTAKGYISFDIPTGYRAALGVYENQGDNYALVFDSGWQENAYISTYGEGTIYRVVVSKTDDTDIDIARGDGVIIREYFDVESHAKRIATLENDVVTVNLRFESTRNIFTSASAWVNGDIQGKNGGVFVASTEGEFAAMPSYLPIIPGDYVVSWSGTNCDTNLYLHFYDADINFIEYQTFYNLSGGGYRTFTVPENVAYYRVSAYSAGCDIWTNVVPINIQIESGSTPTAYINPKAIKMSCLDVDKLVKCLPNIPKKPFMSATIRSIAHRGEPIEYPQCTKPAYIASKKLGFNIAENDLFNSADGSLVMWHDSTLARLGEYLQDINGYTLYTDGTTVYYYNASTSLLYEYADGYKPSSIGVTTLTAMKGADYGVQDLSLSTLKRIDFGKYKGSAFAGTQILTFGEWVQLCKWLGLEIYIDKKITLTESIVSEMVQTVKKYGMINHTSWFVWDMTEASLIRDKIADARLVFLDAPTESNIESRASLLTNGAVVFNPHTSELTTENTSTALEAGYEVECWHVDYSAYGFETTDDIFTEIMRVCYLGVGGITLDKYSVEDVILANI